MSAIGDEVDALVAHLVAAGLAATADPTAVLSMAAEAGYCALVAPPEVSRVLLDGALVLQVPVRVAVRPPGGLGDYRLAWEALETLVAVLPASEVTREPLTLNDQILPGYLVSATRRTTT